VRAGRTGSLRPARRRLTQAYLGAHSGRLKPAQAAQKWSPECASSPDWCANRAALRSAGTSSLSRVKSACLLQIKVTVNDDGDDRSWRYGVNELSALDAETRDDGVIIRPIASFSAARAAYARNTQAQAPKSCPEVRVGLSAAVLQRRAQARRRDVGASRLVLSRRWGEKQFDLLHYLL
jgi:hypothetical protein